MIHMTAVTEQGKWREWGKASLEYTLLGGKRTKTTKNRLMETSILLKLQGSLLIVILLKYFTSFNCTKCYAS